MRSRPTGFQLTKWYMDVVDPHGAGAIVYHAVMKWRGLCIRYGEVLQFMSGHRATSNVTFRPGAEPRLAVSSGGSHLSCEVTRLGLAGIWEGDTHGLSVCIHDAEEGRIDWHCVLPRADVDLALGDSRICGVGYAERLEMTLPPGRLPMNEIRWGRFLSEDSWATWIHWSGPTSRIWILDPRGLREVGDVNDSIVATDAWRIDLDGERRVVRDAALGSLFSGPAALMKPLFGRGVMGIHETKWLTFATLRQVQPPSAGFDAVSGWALHELVRLPGSPGRRLVT